MNGTGEALDYANCPACDSTKSLVWLEDGKPTRYMRCRQCGSVYASPRAPWAKRYAWLDQSFGLGDTALQNAANRQQALAEEAVMIQRQLNGGRLLDVGCDLGDLFGWFPDPAWERYGIELAPSAAEYAAREYRAQVFTGMLWEADYPDSYFDVVTMLDMLYYLDDPKADLAETKRILKPGGILAVEITGLAYQLLRSRGLLCYLLEGRWTRLQSDSSYLLWASPEGLLRLLEGGGFQVTEWQVVGSPRQANPWRKRAAEIYRGAANWLGKRSFDSLTWAPKYMLLARKAPEV